jgi:allantoinase
VTDFDSVVRGSTVVLPDGPQRLDIGITDGVIAALAPELPGGRNEIDGSDLHVLPGAVDAHIHANDPGHAWEGADYATAGFAVGGTTTAIEMPLNASPPTVTLDGWKTKVATWAGRAHVDYALWGGIIPGNLAQLRSLAEAGVVGFKAFMVDAATDDFPGADDATLFAGMEVAAACGLPVAVHAENAAMIAAGLSGLAASERTAADYLHSRSALAEREAVARALLLAEAAGCALHIVHLSTGRAVEMVREARTRGQDVTCETCAHYIALTDEDVGRIGTNAKCSPPIRDAGERDALWEALAAGAVDMVTTDHAPGPADGKDGDFFTAWAGIVGGQLLAGVLVSEGHLVRGVSLEQLVTVMSSTPADRFRIPGKGHIAVGADADLVLFDLGVERTVTPGEILHRHPEQSPYVGMSLRGRPVRTLLRGMTIALDGAIAGPPCGRLLRPRA